jgi:hypothetical protein
MSSIPLHHSKFTRDIMGYFRTSAKRHYQQLKIIVVVYPLGYHHRALHDGFKCFPAFIFPNYKNVESNARLDCYFLLILSTQQ